MLRSSWLLLLIGLVCACERTSGAYFDVEVLARGSQVVDVEVGQGWRLTLERAELAWGPFYACSTEAASPDFCPEAVLEVREALVIDALENEVVPVGLSQARTAVANTAMWDFGISWRATEGRAKALPEAPEGHSMIFRGRATHADGRSFSIACDVDLPPSLRGSTVVTGRTVGSHQIASGDQLLTVWNVAAWWRSVSFEELAERDEEAVVLAALDPQYDALLRAIESSEQPTFEWKPKEN